MARKLKNTSSTIVVVLLAGAIGGTHLLTDYINESLNSLTIAALPNTDTAKSNFDTNAWLRSLAPVLVEGHSKGDLAAEPGSVDALFKAPPAPVAQTPAAPPEPDYAELLGSVMRVDGIARNGAFINGKFYNVGEPITDYEYPAKGRQITPFIAQIGAESIFVKHGSRITELRP